MNEWDSFLLSFRQSMEAIFYPDTLEEWLEENVNEHIERLGEMVVDVERIIALNGKPKADPVKTRWNRQPDQQEGHSKMWLSNLLCSVMGVFFHLRNLAYFLKASMEVITLKKMQYSKKKTKKKTSNYTMYALLEEVDSLHCALMLFSYLS